jgi:acetyl-CoA carboxylase biotin carboxylase subunit
MKKILIANRGEIARRIIRTANKMGILTVAVYSEADREALFVQEANEAICIGPAPSKESYLDINKIIEAAKKTNADAIHPGYGFLSERANFSQAVFDAGLEFIGPSASSIHLMGDKIEAKKCARAMDVPMLGGTKESVTDINVCKQIAKEIGYPILIKAAAGGGGKGMRIVYDEAAMEENIALASNEALSSFGDGAVFIEKFLTAPKHIEVQIIADKHGNVCYLFERECSIQRRHQKIIEEAPSVSITSEVRKQIGEAAVRMALSCKYHGAGTVEFLLDDQQKFYFLEMNTRIQVEHPVTEFITGLDLIELQIRISRGEKLPFKQEDLTINGHAIELRVNAEDPYEDFTPSIGVLTKYKIPAGDGIRVDDAYCEGQEIPIYYDPMIGKLIVHGKTRIEAIQKLKSAIKNFTIEGIQTSLVYGEFILRHPEFINASMTTKFSENTMQEFLTENTFVKEEELACIIGLEVYLKELNKLKPNSNQDNLWYQNRKSLRS